MKMRGVLRKGLALLLALMLVLATFSLAEDAVAPAEEIAVEESIEPAAEPAEGPVEEAAEEPAEEPVEEPAEEPVEEPMEEPAEEPTEEPIEEPTEDPVEEPTEEPIEEPAEQPEGEAVPEATEQPLVAEEPLPEEPAEEVTPEASVAVTVEIAGEGALRALLQVEGAVEEVAYRWQAMDRAAFGEVLEAGAEDLDSLWFDIEGADGAELDAAAAMGENFAAYSYRCAVTAGELSALSGAITFPDEAPLEGDIDIEIAQPDVLKPNCKHKFEDYTRLSLQSIIETTAETHTITIMQITGKKCSVCGAFSDYKVEYVTRGPEKHVYGYDESYENYYPGLCSLCRRPCGHEKATKREWAEYWDSTVSPYMAISETQHVKVHLVAEKVECPTCHMSIYGSAEGTAHLVEDGKPEEHHINAWGECEECGFVPECDGSDDGQHHFNFDDPDAYTEVWYDSYTPSADGTKCIGHGKTVRTEARCEDCYESTYKLEYDPDAVDELEHVTQEDGVTHSDKFGMCIHCGVVQVCKHAHTVEVVDEDYHSFSEDASAKDLLLGEEVVSNGNGTHTGKLVRRYSVTCLDCYASWPREEVVEITEFCKSSDYDSDVCDICGYKGVVDPVKCQFPEHPEDQREYIGIRYVSSAKQDPSDSNRHLVTAGEFEYFCKACHTIQCEYDVLDTEETMGHTISLPHVFDENGECVDCGARASCNHSFGEGATYDSRVATDGAMSGGYTRKDGKTHIHSISGGYKVCSDCGALVATGSEGWSEIVEPHTLVNGICVYCGAVYECNHSAITDDTPLLRTETKYIDDADGQHIVRQVNVYKCPECTAEVKKEDLASDVREPHVFDTHGQCTLCGHSDYYTELKFLESKLKMGKGEKIYSGLSVTPRNGAGEITFKSSKTKIAQVDAQGVITAKGIGKAKITATCKRPDGETLKAELNIEVAKKPKNLKLDNYLLDMGLDETYKLTATPPSGSGAITWSSDNEAVATVQDGAVKAVSKGAALICAKISDGVAAFCRVTVKDAPTAENVALNLERSVFGAGEKAQATLTYTDAAGACKFTSSATGVATVDPKTGAIAAVAAGDATITAKTYNGVELTKQITVKPAPTKLVFEEYQNKLGAHEEWQLGVKLVAEVNGQEVESAGAVTFSSSKGSVISVDKATGKLTGKKTGSAKITAKAYNGKKASISIKVMKQPSDFKFESNQATIGVGETGNMYDLFTPVFGNSKQYGHVDWASYQDGQYVKIVGDRFTGVGVGMEDFMADVYRDTMDEKPFFANYTIIVKEAPVAEGMHLTLPRATLGIGETVGAGFTYDEPYGGSHDFATGDKNIATVDAKTGAIKGKKAGKTSVTVKAYNGVSVQQEIEVVAKPTKVSLQNKITKIGIGESWKLGVTVKSGSIDTTGKVGCTFTSSKPDVLAVNSETGELTALKTGKAKITVKTYNKKSASVTIQVVATPTQG